MASRTVGRAAVEDGPFGLWKVGASCLIIVARNRKTLPQTTELLDRIEALLESSDSREEVERALTDGYARALSLETKRLRLQRQVAKLDDELGRLRGRLAVLRNDASAA